MTSNSAPDAVPPLDRLREIVRRLRGEGGCPWDREQTLESLRPYLIEESYEVLDALEAGGTGQHCEELGDVLLQIYLHAQIREEDGEFTIDDVARTLCEKLVRRHPHVFGDVDAADSATVLKNWERIKASEKDTGDARSLTDGIPTQLPALQKAQRMQSRVSRAGFDWDTVDGALAKVEEELAEIREALEEDRQEAVQEEIGDILFAVVNLCRFRKINAEDALRRTVDKFATRFRRIEARVQAEGRRVEDCTLEELDTHWNAVKRRESSEEDRPPRLYKDEDRD